MKTTSPQQPTVPQGPRVRRALHPSTPDQDIDTEPASTSPEKTIIDGRVSRKTGENSPETISRIEENRVTDDESDSERIEDGVQGQQLRRSVEPDPARQKAAQFIPKTSVLENAEQPPKRPKNSVGIVLTMMIGVLTAILYFSMFSSVTKEEPKLRQSCESFLQLNSKYPNTDDMLWSTLIVGLKRAVNDPGEPATFIFLYNSSSVGQSLLNDVIRITMDCFGNGDAIWRTSNDFKSTKVAEDYSAELERHRAELTSQKVMVVRDLDKVPPVAAQIFFTICDSYEPLVPKAAIFFTIDISRRNVNQSNHPNPTSIAEDILKDLWRKELHPNVLDPLVVRLTENVFKIE